MNYRDNLREKKISIFLCPRKQIEPHSHNFLELGYVLRGEAIHKWDDSSAYIKEGDYFVIDYKSQHSYEAKTDHFELINCLFVPELIDPALVNCRSFSSLVSSYQIHFNMELFTASPSGSIYRDDSGKIKELLLTVLNEFNEKAPGYIQLIRAHIIEILIITMRKIYFDPKSDMEDSDMVQILKYINTEYMHDLTLADICRKFGYSFSYLSAKFKKLLGITYTSYLQKVRIEQSMRLLAHTNLPVNEIAQEVGYRDIKSFYTIFKKITNTTPAKFRKNYFT